MVGLHQHAAANGRREPGLEVTRLARREPLHGKSKLLAEPILALQSRLLVCVDGDVERSDLAVARGTARVELELGDERRVPRRRVPVDGDNGFLAELGFADRGDHSRGKVRGARPGIGIHDCHADAGSSGPPGHGETDDTPADDRYVHAHPPILVRVYEDGSIAPMRSRR